MLNFILAVFGGALGSGSRYLLSCFISHYTLQNKFPYGTFIVNVIGCFFAGLLFGLIEKQELVSKEAIVFY